jgi:hypothetical protein
LSLTFLSEATGVHRRSIDRELSDLIDRNIIRVVKAEKRKTRVIKFNKNYEEWLENTPQKVIQLPEREEKPVKKPAKKKTYDENNQYYKMALYFHERVKTVGKEAGVEHLIKNANLQTWADDFRKLVEVDGMVDKKLIKKVMDWVTSHHFWRKNVLSGKKFREKFSELAISMRSESEPKKQHPSFSQPDPRDKEIALQKWIAEGKDPDEFDWSK